MTSPLAALTASFINSLCTAPGKRGEAHVPDATRDGPGMVVLSLVSSEAATAATSGGPGMVVHLLVSSEAAFGARKRTTYGYGAR
ncbi:hypothetical protein PHYPSEUDO_006660 [Phytophthora pseudosyringae]|uniref:Uncharacterized protein n=1 Tax=Phytophthora pseudosyringae TaxID=221518 RepID=A0A8T1WDY7_9STRA|nr:hypothetical protein PHYPSEUDO_006660 [Phytophthora pseudosyringae]